MSGLTDQDARALTFIACRIRKEVHGAREWDDAGTYAEISKLLGHNLPIVVERVTRHAGDVEAKTPGAIRRPFIPAAPDNGNRQPAKAGDDCRIHPGEWADNCRACASDRLAGDVTPRRPLEAVSDPAPNVARLRALRDEVAADLCSHGVAPGLCVDHRRPIATTEPEGA